MGVRVISGIAKGHTLQVPRGLIVRPTPERAREALFNILGDRVLDARFLDLYAGSGAIGVEALSRGAREAVFVEKRPRVAAIVKRNLTKTRLAEHALVIVRDVSDALKWLIKARKTFDIVFGDPPYNSRTAPEILQFIGNKGLLDENGIVVWEHASGTGIPANVGNLLSFKEVRYGDTSFSFLS